MRDKRWENVYASVESCYDAWFLKADRVEFRIYVEYDGILFKSRILQLRKDIEDLPALYAIVLDTMVDSIDIQLYESDLQEAYIQNAYFDLTSAHTRGTITPNDARRILGLDEI